MKHIFRKHYETINEGVSCIMDDTLLKNVLLDILSMKFENPDELKDLKTLYNDCGFGLGGEIKVEMALLEFSKIRFIGETIPFICD